MKFLRFVCKEIRSLRLVVKIAGLVFGIAFIVSVWYLGVNWWTGPTNVAPWYVPRRMRPRLEYFAVILGLILIPYLASLIGRYQKRR